MGVFAVDHSVLLWVVHGMTNNTPTGADQTTGGKTILLVEDEALIALSEQATLERRGYRVIHASNGEQAVAAARETSAIDLVLMDIDLGRGMDGTQAAERILAMREIPVVFLTSHAEREMVERVKDITRYGYVLKSAGEFVLMESISMAFELFETHRELQRSSDHYRSVVRLSGEIVVQHATDHRRVFVNRNACEFWGKSEEELLGESPEDLIHPEDRAATRDAIDAMVRTNEPIWRLVNRQRTPRGWRVVEWNSAPITNEHGDCVGYQATGRDVTRRKQIEAELRGYKQAADSAESMIVAIDRSHRYTLANRSFLQRYGLRRDQVVGAHASEIVGRELYEAVLKDRIDECLQGEPVTFDVDREYPGIGIRSMSISYSPIRAEGEVTGLVGIFRDSTEIRATQRRLTSSSRVRTCSRPSPGARFRAAARTRSSRTRSPSSRGTSPRVEPSTRRSTPTVSCACSSRDNRRRCPTSRDPSSTCAAPRPTSTCCARARRSSRPTLPPTNRSGPYETCSSRT